MKLKQKVIFLALTLAFLPQTSFAQQQQTYTLFYSDDYGVYFADGHFFYMTCEKADEVIKKSDMRSYPWLKGLRPVSIGQLVQLRESLSFLQCFRMSRNVAEKEEKYGSADDLMKRHYGN